MQSRFALTLAAAKLNRSLLAAGRIRGCATTSGRTADPAEHAVEEEDVYPSDAMQNQMQDEKRPKTSKVDESYIPPNPNPNPNPIRNSKSPTTAAPSLKSSGVAPPTDPVAQQKRRSTCTVVDSVSCSCAGMDGSPWPEEESDMKSQREDEERDNKEYFEHHKASPLSEIEVCDTRKPITQATDGTATNHTVTVGYDGNYGGGLWRPEQLDTAEEALRRAADMFRINAVRGDPDSPHGRVLRHLRGEDW